MSSRTRMGKIKKFDAATWWGDSAWQNMHCTTTCSLHFVHLSTPQSLCALHFQQGTARAWRSATKGRLQNLQVARPGVLPAPQLSQMPSVSSPCCIPEV